MGGRPKIMQYVCAFIVMELPFLSAVFTCIGDLDTPAERGPSLESIYREEDDIQF